MCPAHEAVLGCIANYTIPHTKSWKGINLISVSGLLRWHVCPGTFRLVSSQKKKVGGGALRVNLIKNQATGKVAWGGEDGACSRLAASQTLHLKKENKIWSHSLRDTPAVLKSCISEKKKILTRTTKHQPWKHTSYITATTITNNQCLDNLNKQQLTDTLSTKLVAPLYVLMSSSSTLAHQTKED